MTSDILLSATERKVGVMRNIQTRVLGFIKKKLKESWSRINDACIRFGKPTTKEKLKKYLLKASISLIQLLISAVVAYYVTLFMNSVLVT